MLRIVQSMSGVLMRWIAVLMISTLVVFIASTSLSTTWYFPVPLVFIRFLVHVNFLFTSARSVPSSFLVVHSLLYHSTSPISCTYDWNALLCYHFTSVLCFVYFLKQDNVFSWRGPPISPNHGPHLPHALMCCVLIHSFSASPLNQSPSHYSSPSHLGLSQRNKSQVT